MNAKQRGLRRRQIDRQFARIDQAAPTPREGWLRTFREALGMSLETFGERLGITRQAAQYIEKGEVTERISVRRLREAADALGCDLRVVLVPREPLEKQIGTQALKVAREKVRRVGHTMSLEAQAVGSQEFERLVQQTARDMVDRGDPRIWS